MTIDHCTKVVRASYMPHLKPGVTEITVQIVGQLDIARGDTVTISIPEGEVK